MDGVSEAGDGMKALHKQPCPVCSTGYRRTHEEMCGKCHEASGGKFCLCGAHIERYDRCCRDCWSAYTKPCSMTNKGGIKSDGHGQSDVASVDLSQYRMETTQVDSASIEHDGGWSHLLSPETKKRYDAWRAQNPRMHGNTKTAQS